jgi:deoxyinosine 3'endonuclease (endonuclease V)
MDETLSKWREEQLQIASKLLIVDDNVSELENCQGKSNKFSRARLSQSIKDKLIGGVDVSFGEDDRAIAVYVITRNHEVIYQDSLVYTIDQPYVSSYLGKYEVQNENQGVIIYALY